MLLKMIRLMLLKVLSLGIVIVISAGSVSTALGGTDGFCRPPSRPHAQKANRIVVTDFGAIPDSRKDAVSAIRKALATCKRSRNTVLVFPKGQYDLYPDSAIKKEYFISNTSSETECPSKLKTIGLLLEGMKDCTIEG